MKIYKIKLNDKVYEVELEEVKEMSGSIEKPKATETVSKSNESAASSKPGSGVNAPMPGTIVDVFVNPGEPVKKGKLLALLEAMKMETEIFASEDGVVDRVHVSKGAQVSLGDPLISLA